MGITSFSNIPTTASSDLSVSASTNTSKSSFSEGSPEPWSGSGRAFQQLRLPRRLLESSSPSEASLSVPLWVTLWPLSNGGGRSVEPSPPTGATSRRRSRDSWGRGELGSRVSGGTSGGGRLLEESRVFEEGREIGD